MKDKKPRTVDEFIYKKLVAFQSVFLIEPES